MNRATYLTFLRPKRVSFAKKKRKREEPEEEGIGPTREAFLHAVQVHGSAESAWMAMNKDNFTQREKVRKYKKEVEEFEDAQPEEGGLVLSKAEAETWTAYKELGDLKVVKAQAEELTRLQAATVSDVITKAANALGWNPTVLKQLADQNKLDIQFVASKDDKGKAVEIPVVLAIDPQTKAKVQHDLGDYAKTAPALAPFLPALVAKADKNGAVTDTESEPTQFTPFLLQPAGTEKPGEKSGPAKLSDMPGVFAKRRSSAVNPLARIGNVGEPPATAADKP